MSEYGRYARCPQRDEPTVSPHIVDRRRFGLGQRVNTPDHQRLREDHSRFVEPLPRSRSSLAVSQRTKLIG
jgi:hypothetical protein